jgi:DNA-binding SARP family transcriptional activator
MIPHGLYLQAAFIIRSGRDKTVTTWLRMPLSQATRVTKTIQSWFSGYKHYLRMGSLIRKYDGKLLLSSNCQSPLSRLDCHGMFRGLRRLAFSAECCFFVESPVKLYLLGAPRLEIEGKSVSLGRRKSMALLSYLAVTGQASGRPTLAALLWPESDPCAAFASLRQALAALRKSLGEGCLEVDRSIVRLCPEGSLWVDTYEFDRYLAGTPDRAGLRRAAALYQADFMAGFAVRGAPDFDTWQLAQTERCRSAYARLLAQLTPVLIQASQLDEALSYARRWCLLEPLHEPARAAMIYLVAEMGRPTAAHEQYDHFANQLQAETGQRPSFTLEQALAGNLPGALNDNQRPSSYRQL